MRVRRERKDGRHASIKTKMLYIVFSPCFRQAQRMLYTVHLCLLLFMSFMLFMLPVPYDIHRTEDS